MPRDRRSYMERFRDKDYVDYVEMAYEVSRQVKSGEEMRPDVPGQSMIANPRTLAVMDWVGQNEGRTKELFANILMKGDLSDYERLLLSLEDKSDFWNSHGQKHLAEVLNAVKEKFMVFCTDAMRKVGQEVEMITCGRCGAPMLGGIRKCGWCGSGIKPKGR